MKIRILMLSIIGLMFFNSCSSDSNSSNSTSQNLDPNTILPKKIIRESELGGSSTSYEFYYNQNKLDHIHCFLFDNGYSVAEFDFNYTYNGNLISEINVIDNSGDVYRKIEFSYLNSKLVNKKITDNNNSNIYYTEFNYTYNSSNDIITRNQTFDGNTTTITDTFTIENNLIFKNNFGYNEGDYTFTSSPFKNIIGIKDAFIEGGLEFSQNSYLSGYFLNDIFFSTTKNIIRVGGANYVYIYNDIEFPTSVFIDIDSSDSTIFQIFYQ